MRRPFRGKLSKREHQERLNASFQFFGLPQYMKELPPKRERVVRPADKRPRSQTEAGVNDEIYDTAKRLEQGPLWRNNRGVAQYGNHIVTYGVGPNGASDWIGYRRLLITADMVGSTIAQFVALEAKRPGESADEKQKRFLDRVIADGACAGVATSGEQAQEILTSWPKRARDA